MENKEDKNTSKNDKKYFENTEVEKSKDGLDEFLKEKEENKKEEINLDTDAKYKEIKKKNKLAKMKEFNEWFICIIIAVVLAFLIKFFVGTFTTVKQTSMYPTFKDGDRLWLNRLTRTFNSEYERGDIITFEAPKSENINVSNSHPKAIFYDIEGFAHKFKYYFVETEKISLIKRIIALPGERVEIKDGDIYINGQKLEEPYLNKDVKTESNKLNEFIVPEGHYFLLGDNRPGSSDSRIFGCIPKEKIEGRIGLYIYPFLNFGFIKKDQKGKLPDE